MSTSLNFVKTFGFATRNDICKICGKEIKIGELVIYYYSKHQVHCTCYFSKQLSTRRDVDKVLEKVKYSLDYVNEYLRICSKLLNYLKKLKNCAKGRRVSIKGKAICYYMNIDEVMKVNRVLLIVSKICELNSNSNSKILSRLVINREDFDKVINCVEKFKLILENTKKDLEEILTNGVSKRG